jgi:hypothetical protein
MELVEQFLVGEPDKIVEVNWNELIGILNLQVKLGPVGGVLKTIKDIPESAGFAKHPRSLFEIILAYGLPDLQAARRDDFVRRVALCTGCVNGNKFEG